MPTKRSGFTLVEMMVAITLTIFVMVILSQCFVQGLETFSGFKAIGDMQEQLRTATTLLRSDLSQDHFGSKRRLSDPVSNFKPPDGKIQKGFFVIGQGYPNQPSGIIPEGVEDGIPSFRATDHWLHFSVKMRGNAREKFFSAVDFTSAPFVPLGVISSSYFNQFTDAAFDEPLATNTYFSAWAEVAYFLVKTGTVTPGNPQGPGTPVFALYRCQFLVFPNNSLDQSATILSPNTRGAAGNMGFQFFQGFSCKGPNPIHFFSPEDLASGWSGRAFNPYDVSQFPPLAGSVPRASTLVLSNVVSFQVEVLKNPSVSGDFDDLGLIAIDPVTGKTFPCPFDTANYVNNPPPVPNPPSANPITPVPPTFSIQGLQIILRIWDPGSRSTRQVTLLQDM